MKKKMCRILTLLLSFSIALCMVIGMASAQSSENSTIKLTIGDNHSTATIADDDEVYSTCPNVAISIKISSSIDQTYTFTSSDGASVKATLTKSGYSSITIGGINVTTYSKTYSISMSTSGTHKITAKGATSGSTSFTLIVEHTPVDDPAVEPTCTQTGLTEGSHCSTCGEVFEAQETLPALGHTPVIDEGIAPTCTEPGLTEGSHCSVCNEVLEEQEVIPAGHTWDEGEIITEPTCSEEGEMFYVCTVCGETKTEPIDTLPHTWSEATWNWSEDNSEASATWTCEVCGTPETKNAEVTSETTATCTEAGETTYTATVTLDDVEYTDEKTSETEALGHDWETEWTWSEDHTSATASRTCKNCGIEETFEATVSGPTEDEDGSIVYTATVTLDDGTELTDTYIEPGEETEEPGANENPEDTEEPDNDEKKGESGSGTASSTSGSGSDTGTSGTGSTGTGSSGNSGYSGSSGNNGSTATSPQTDDPTSFSAWWIIALGIGFCFAGCGALVLYRFRKVSVKN